MPEPSPEAWRESTDWQILSDAVARLKRQVEAAYYACDDQAAGDLHDDLLSAEWRLRQAERKPPAG